MLVGSTFGNKTTATSYGAEMLAKWQPTDNWQLVSNYTVFKLDAHSKEGFSSGYLLSLEKADPRHQFSIRSDLKLPYHFGFNSMFYYTDQVQARNMNISDQGRMDLRLAWMPSQTLELSVVGQNILNKQHQEYFSLDIFNTQIPRRVYGRIILRF